MACPRVVISRALLRMVRLQSGTLVSRCLRILSEGDGAALSSVSTSICTDWVVVILSSGRWEDKSRSGKLPGFISLK